ncbi:hypothetical protein JL720_13539 [Aureococcus anophagefferens]|nr:hypothetical protein JL720_13539 [Aureococcus anophagefferens]
MPPRLRGDAGGRAAERRTRVLLEGDGLAPRDDYAVATRCAFGAADATAAAAAGVDAVACAAPTLNEATAWAPRDGDEAVSVSVRVSVNGEAFLDVGSFTYESRAARSDCGVEAAAPPSAAAARC